MERYNHRCVWTRSLPLPLGTLPRTHARKHCEKRPSPAASGHTCPLAWPSSSAARGSAVAKPPAGSAELSSSATPDGCAWEPLAAATGELAECCARAAALEGWLVVASLREPCSAAAAAPATGRGVQVIGASWKELMPMQLCWLGVRSLSSAGKVDPFNQRDVCYKCSGSPHELFESRCTQPRHTHSPAPLHLVVVRCKELQQYKELHTHINDQPKPPNFSQT